MFEKLRDNLRRVIGKVIGSQSIERALQINTVLSPEMEAAIRLWGSVYQNRAPWLNQEVRSLGLAGTICSKVARVALVEKDIKIDGGARGEYLAAQFIPFAAKLRENLEYALAQGGMMFKPYISGRDILIDCVRPDSFVPTEVNGRGEIIGCVFLDTVRKGDAVYNRLEQHRISGGGYEITNTAYKSYTQNELGVKISLTVLPEWAGLKERIFIANLKRPLFGYFQAPHANTVDSRGHMGESIFARAVGLIREADVHWSWYGWEFESARRRLFADETAFNPATGEMDKLYVGLDLSDESAFHEFSPEIRDTPFYSKLQAIFKRIEFNCGLAYGMLSDPQSKELTATEVISSRQDLYDTVEDIHRALETAIGQLLTGMDTLAALGNLAPAGAYTVTYDWGDSVLTDRDAERAIRMQEVAAGLLRPEEYRMWRYGEDEETARKNLPGMETLAKPEVE